MLSCHEYFVPNPVSSFPRKINMTVACYVSWWFIGFEERREKQMKKEWSENWYKHSASRNPPTKRYGTWQRLSLYCQEITKNSLQLASTFSYLSICHLPIHAHICYGVFPGCSYSNIFCLHMCQVLCTPRSLQTGSHLILSIAYYPHFTGGETETHKDDETPQGQTAAQCQSRDWHQAVWLWRPYSEPVSDAARLQGGAACHLWGPGGLAMKSSEPCTSKTVFTSRLSPLLARGPYTKVLHLGGSQAPCVLTVHSPSGYGRD